MAKANNSKEKILEAAKEVIKEEGYSALSSRRVAAKAGLKPQLIHYYFDSMDHLLIEIFGLLATEVVNKQKIAIQSETPLKNLWTVLSDRDMRTMLEQFLIMSQYNEDLQRKLGEFGNIYREDQINFFRELMRENNFDHPHWSPEFLSILFNALARVITIEPTYGLNLGIREALKTIEHYINEYDRGISNPETTIKRLEQENARLRATIAELEQGQS